MSQADLEAAGRKVGERLGEILNAPYEEPSAKIAPRKKRAAAFDLDGRRQAPRRKR
jgi:hypothetical protein